jgi:hypothetical protein
VHTAVKCHVALLSRTGCEFRLIVQRQTFIEVPNIKFRDSPSSESLADACGRTDGQTDRRTDIAKLIGAFRARRKI